MLQVVQCHFLEVSRGGSGSKHYLFEYLSLHHVVGGMEGSKAIESTQNTRQCCLLMQEHLFRVAASCTFYLGDPGSVAA